MITLHAPALNPTADLAERLRTAHSRLARQVLCASALHVASLKTSLKAESDLEAWESLNSDTSELAAALGQPFLEPLDQLAAALALDADGEAPGAAEQPRLGWQRLLPPLHLQQGKDGVVAGGAVWEKAMGLVQGEGLQGASGQEPGARRTPCARENSGGRLRVPRQRVLSPSTCHLCDRAQRVCPQVLNASRPLPQMLLALQLPLAPLEADSAAGAGAPGG